MAGRPLLFAHRGGAKLAPENTLEAFEHAFHVWGADVLEMDVRMTKDGALVVIHDPAVDRTTNGSGAVEALTLSEVQALDAGYRFVDTEGHASYRGKGVRIPLFDEVLRRLPGARLNVDAKSPGSTPPLIDAVRAAGAEHRVLLASIFEEGRAIRYGYKGPTSATRRQLRLFHYLHRLPWGAGYTPSTDALQVPYEWEGTRVTTPRLVREAHRRNLPVHVWTVDDPAVMRTLVEWGVDGIQTDRPDVLSWVLHETVGRPLPTGHVKAPPAPGHGA
jgi:glycerophosphoryl diester phosphodiesterase